MIAARSAGSPDLLLFFGAGLSIRGGQRVKAAARKTSLVSRLSGRQGVLPKTFEHMTDERRCMTMQQLLMLFRAGMIRAEGPPTASLFVGPRYARTSSKTGCRGQEPSPPKNLFLFC